MKFYETTYDEYLNALSKNNFHPELKSIVDSLPNDLTKLPNLIFYGASGTGKYTQVLNVIKRYSLNGLSSHQYKRMNLQTEKYEYSYHMSDIHYEIDMSLLGCNSKLIWHDVIQQIVDIVTVKPDTHKTAIIVCKNFHMIHSELLDIFYSYMQEYSSVFAIVHLKFILVTEHLCFIPNNIITSSTIINVCRPENKMAATTTTDALSTDLSTQNPIAFKPGTKLSVNPLCSVHSDDVLNLKEYYHLNKLKSTDDIPDDIFNIVCNEILKFYSSASTLVLHNKATAFRDAIYDIFIYNLDPVECVWHIISHLIVTGHLHGDAISDVMVRSYNFLKYFNNNYRPIYHLEAIFYYTLLKINGINELDKCV